MTDFKRFLRAAAIVIAAQFTLLAVVTPFLPLRRWALREAIPLDYFVNEAAREGVLRQVAPRLYTFDHGIDRSFIIEGSDGLTVIDSYSREFAAALRLALSARFPGARVKNLLYSHQHLDHIRGGAELQPEVVMAHEKLWATVEDWPHDDVLPPTRTLRGDEELDLGGVRVQALYLGRSHTDTLYAFLFPAQRVLFAPDTAFLHALPPFGLPDWYFPGYLRALDRLVALDFETCIPSHFKTGTKADLVAFRDMMRDFRQVAADGIARRGGTPSTGELVREVFDEAYPTLEARYGDWHGFHAMFVPHFIGSIGGNYLGY